MWRHTHARRIAMIERLEARRLLSFGPGRDPPAAQPLDPAYVIAADNAAAHVDSAWVRAEVIRFVDTWNGGQLRELGTGGMGTYSPTWDGLFRMNLDRQFNRISYYTNDQTIISQSRAIYMNVEAYRTADASAKPRFKAAVQKGADYLLSQAVDPQVYDGKPGGMWWGLQIDGTSPPTHTTQIFGTLPRNKDAYGQVQAIFALANAWSVTGDADHLNGAFAQLNVWNTQFADTAAGAGAFLPTATENYAQRVGTRNVDYMTHALEALLAIHDLTPAADPRRSALAAQITDMGNFITTRMYRDATGSTTMGYLPWYYDGQWNPSTTAGQRFITPGHNLEVAFLLSRAVERGFNSAWLGVANKLIAFAIRYGYDDNPTSPTYGAVRYEELNFDGTPFNATPDNLVWWQTSEAARTLLHFAQVRGRADLWDEFDASFAFIRNRFMDSTYGGWYQSLSPATLAPTNTNKGTVWTGGYHESMLYAEMLRLNPPRPPQPTPFLGAPFAIPSSGSATIQAEHFDNGGEAVAYHDTDPINSGKAYRTTGVDIQTTTDTGAGYNIGWTRAGEWLAYTVNVAAAGTYDLDLRFASPASGAKLHLELDGTNATGPMTLPSTAGWQNWQTLRKSGITLPAGQHVLRLFIDSVASSGAAGNLNWLRFTRGGSTQITLTSSTATFVRDGSFASTNYGSNPVLEVKKSTTGYNRETYLKFDLASVASIGAAKLRLNGKMADNLTSAITIGVHGAASSWTESGLTWATRPSAASTPLAKVAVSGTGSRWYEVDLTAYLKLEKAAGRNQVTLVLRSATFTSTMCTFNSDDAAVNRPELVITAA